MSTEATIFATAGDLLSAIEPSAGGHRNTRSPISTPPSPPPARRSQPGPPLATGRATRH